jgi:hypothetical protein
MKDASSSIKCRSKIIALCLWIACFAQINTQIHAFTSAPLLLSTATIRIQKREQPRLKQQQKSENEKEAQAEVRRQGQDSTSSRQIRAQTGNKDDASRQTKSQSQQQLEAKTSDDKSFNLTQVDVIYGSKTSLVYDTRKERFLPSTFIREELAEIKLEKRTSVLLRPIVSSPPVRACRRLIAHQIKPYLSAALIPDGVTPAYYRYASWRTFQRLINANLHVFGTRSLLMGLGIKTKSLAAASAALNWVLKDALGKIIRMIWASRMGGKFDRYV